MKIYIKLIILLILFILFFSSAFSIEEEIKNKKKIKALEMLAYYFYKKKNFQKSLEEYKKILTFEPQNPKIHYNIGLLYAFTKKYSLAIKKLKMVAKTNSSFKKDALYNLTIIYGKYLNDKEKALEFYKKFKSIESKQCQNLLKLD